MSEVEALVVFFASLALSVISSLVLATTVDRVGVRLGLSEGLLGLVTALGADAPEISAALTAISKGSGQVGVGVVLGSCIFNIAALLGLSAVIAGRVSIHRRGLLFNGVVALLVALVALVLVLGLIGGVLALVLLVVVFAPYVALAALRPPQVQRHVPAGSVQHFLSLALAEEEKDVRSGKPAPRASRHDVLTVVPALVSVVLASIGLVDSAQSLGMRWGVSQAILGTLVLAVLTSIPNVIAAVRLAQRGRGSAVVSEALNSNSLNLMVGLAVPAVIVGLGTVSTAGIISVVWLLGLTATTLVLTYFRGGLRRYEGVAVIAIYLAFVGLIIAV